MLRVKRTGWEACVSCGVANVTGRTCIWCAWTCINWACGSGIPKSLSGFEEDQWRMPCAFWSEKGPPGGGVLYFRYKCWVHWREHCSWQERAASSDQDLHKTNFIVRTVVPKPHFQCHHMGSPGLMHPLSRGLQTSHQARTMNLCPVHGLCTTMPAGHCSSS